ncbi:hypothetical protein NDU88_003394 [Pleurodeles waltl]|uniref:Uncharacterized protein n=1 Tax=Pleurodeles waltl TaxID=8319 RepID=A0AAV7SF88_PLEWA|nr:hypothetical protein NDU88_003394 [Pleurodeles waltl]
MKVFLLYRSFPSQAIPPFADLLFYITGSPKPPLYVLIPFDLRTAGFFIFPLAALLPTCLHQLVLSDLRCLRTYLLPKHHSAPLAHRYAPSVVITRSRRGAVLWCPRPYRAPPREESAGPSPARVPLLGLRSEGFRD